VGVAIGDFVLDLSVLHTFGLLENLGYSSHIFHASELNAFMALDKPKWTATRQRLIELLEDGGKDDRLSDNPSLKEKALIPLPGMCIAVMV
jgi:fumarylacetoacetase